MAAGTVGICHDITPTFTAKADLKDVVQFAHEILLGHDTNRPETGDSEAS